MSNTIQDAAVPTMSDVESIVESGDAAVRNLQITQCYHELATALARRLPGHANWCTFATWASKQAGQTIRGEDLKRALERKFDDSEALAAAVRAVAGRLRALGAKQGIAEIRRVVEDVVAPGAAVERASAAVARGNLKVFDEIGREFARFLAYCYADAEPDAANIALFGISLRDGEPPEGQRYLRQAFHRYYQALFEPEGKARAELLLLANLEVGFHEQTRLQPEIVAALNAAVADPDELASRLISAVFPRHAAWILRMRRFFRRLFRGPTPLDDAARALVEAARREARLVVTEHLMTLALPRGVVLRLGQDLSAHFPESLARIANAALLELLARIDPTPDDLRASGATDWGLLAERMHFIADLFRSHHEARELFDAPFDAAQVESLREGRRPAGRL